MSDSRLFNICPECGSTKIAPDKYKALFKINEWKCISCRHIWTSLEKSDREIPKRNRIERII